MSLNRTVAGLAALSVVLVLALEARAGIAAITEGKAGMLALDNGNYRLAIQHFTAAIKAGTLKGADLELAYLKRGEAELDLGQIAPGLRDLRKALQLKPDDAEAQQFLQLAESAQPQAPSASAARAAAAERTQRMQAAWGAMARLPGHTYLEIDGKPTMYVQYQWERPWEVLTFTGMVRSGDLLAGRYQLDEATSQISGVSIFKGQAGQSLVQTTPDSFIEDGQSGTSQTRQTFQASGPAAFQLTSALLRNGKWREGKPMQFVEVNQEVIATLGWTTAPPQPSIWSGILSSMKAGALQGFQDGIHDGVHDRTQCGIAGKRTQAPGCTTAQ